MILLLYKQILAEEMLNTLSKFLSTKSVGLKLTSKEGIYGRTIKITIPHIRQDIPVCILMKALGLESDLEIIEKIVLDSDQTEVREIIELLKPSLNEANEYNTQEDALEYISKYANLNGNPRDLKIEKEKKIAYVKEIMYKSNI